MSIESSASTLPDSGESTQTPLGTVKKQMQITTYKNQLTLNDVNTLLDLNYEYEYEYDFENTPDEFVGDFFDRNGDGEPDDFIGDLSGETDIETSTSTRGFGYYLTSVRQIFYPSVDAYAYKISSKLTNLTYNQANVKWARLVFGTYSDLVHGYFAIGPNLIDGASNNNYVRNDYLDEPLYVGILLYFYDSSDTDASFNISFDLDLTCTSYSKDDFMGVESELKKQTQEMENQTEELEEQNEELDKQTEELKQQTETQKGIFKKISEFFDGFFDNLINSVIGLFVPSAEELGAIFQRFDDFFAEKFGFLYYPIDVLTDFASMIISKDSKTVLTFPGFSIMGHEVWKSMEYDLAAVPLVSDVFGYVRTGTGVIIVGSFLLYVDKKFNLITRG